MVYEDHGIHHLKLWINFMIKLNVADEDEKRFRFRGLQSSINNTDEMLIDDPNQDKTIEHVMRN